MPVPLLLFVAPAFPRRRRRDVSKGMQSPVPPRGRRRRGWRCGVAFPRTSRLKASAATWHSCLRRSEMNVSQVVVLVAVVGAAALCAPVDGAAYAWPFAPDQNKSNVATPSASPPSASAPTTTVTGPRQPTPEEREDCQSQIGKIEEGVHISSMRKYDMAKILEEHGGAPGKLNEPLDMDVPEFLVADPTLRPLPDTGNTTFWVYDYKSTDFKTYVRTEHALLRNKGQKDQYLDIRGELYWTPPDFCNKARHATYSQNQTGFQSEVALEYCELSAEWGISCITPIECWTQKDGHRACVGK